ncbi:hypothetical protein KEM52_006017 [Ascosphaera acerosa]|nr:hypothetical protein KEM52_006017 [Ascosphaera acerosa]
MIPEKIDEAGDSSVFLFPKASGRGPSFRIDSAYFAASPSLTFLAHQMDAQQYPSTEVDDDARSVSSTHTRDDAPDDDIAQELQLFLPVPLTGGLPATGPVTHDEDIDMLVLFRNLFAFLVGQSLVATPRFPDLYHILVEIAGLLRRFEFSNLDGSTLGEIVTSSFNSYCNELDLMDMHNDPRRMLQACVLGERMRFYPLYHQGFTFAVGRYNDLETLPEWAQMSNAAKQRIQRAHMELENRINNVTERLTEFSFPSLFSGIANSTVNNEAGLVRFKNWKAATSAMHKFVLHLLKARHGSWPPKPVSKTIPALNRMVLQRLYADMCDLYDILVDRTSLTDRTIDMTTVLNDQKVDPKEAAAKALRGVMSEFDRSSPPVAPPIPFDIPRLPNMDGLKSVKRKTQDKKAQARESARKLTSGEINEILFSSYNTSSMKSTPFLEHFFEFERRQASGKSCNELADNRCGQWLFMYAVIQSLPMTTVDAPDLLFKDGVPSFLCVPPRGGAPWVKDDPKGGKSWYNVVGGNGVVELPSDLVAYSTEGIFRRSHCWDMATLWAREAGLDTPGEDPYTESPVEEYVDEQEQWQHQMPGQFPPLDGTPQPYEHPTSMSITGSEFQSYAGHPQYPQQYTRSRTASMIEGSMDRGYTPLPSQQFPSMQASQYQPYVAPASESPMASPPALRNSGASFGALSAHGQPGPAVLSQHASSQQSVTSSSSNTTGSGNTGSATGRTLPPMLLPANGSSPALSQSGSQSPMSMSQYPCPPPQSLSPISSRPQSPSVVGVGGHPYGVVPRARVPRQTSANRASATHRSSIYAGIEQLPLPQGVVPLDPAPSRVSTYNPNASFDAILKDVSNKDGKKGKKK